MTDRGPADGATGPTDPTPGAITYRLVNYRPILLVVLVGLGLAGIAMLVNLLAGGIGPPAAFVVLWLAVYAWNAYWFLFRVAYEVGVVDASILRWCSMTSCREVPVVRVTGLRTPFPPFGAGLRLITVDGDRSPLIFMSPGFRDVVGMLVEFRPDLVMKTAWYDRLAERFSKRTAQWRRL